MASIGPDVPAHLLARTAAESESAAERPEAGPSIGPPISAQTTPAVPIAPPPVPPVPRYEEEEDEDDYVPELPPDLAAARAKPASGGPPRRTIGPAWGGPFRREEEEEEESEDEIGPAPPPPPGAGSSDARAREDAVTEFMQKEELRRQAIEVRFVVVVPPSLARLRVSSVLISAFAPQEAARPKVLQREEWMLVPPSSSDLLSKLDPTKLNKPRQFSRSTAPAKVVDNTLWTETPAERQQRLADEVMGKKRRVENADPDLVDDAADDGPKRRKREAELQRQVDEYTRTHRGPSMLDTRAQEETRRKKGTSEEPAAIWDHSRDMGLGGRLMDEKDRRRAIQDAKGLSDRFGASKGGSFL